MTSDRFIFSKHSREEILGEVFDKIIISQQHDFLISSSYQFGFKPHSSAVLCNTLLIETIEHYVHHSRQPAYVFLLDVSKAFDRVCYNELFTMLIERNVSLFVIRFLLFMYTNQSMRVKWKGSLSDNFSIGDVLFFLLFTLYIDMLFIRLQELALGCHVGPIFAGSFGYADDVELVAPTLYNNNNNNINCLKSNIQCIEIRVQWTVHLTWIK